MSARVPGAMPDEDSTPNRCARVLVGLYPPAWRARYGTEFTTLLADAGVGVREVADVVPAAAAAWARPVARLHDRAGRMRATVGVTLCAWTVLAAGAVLFAKTTHDGALHLTDHAHPVPAWWYDGYTLAACLSVLAMAAGGLPLAASMLRTSRRVPHHRRVITLLAVPLVAVLGFLGIAEAVVRLVTPAARPATGIGPGWFLVLTVIGLVASAAGAAGPAAALTHARPAGPALTLAVVAGSCATALMAAATAASLAHELTRTDDGPDATALTAYGIVGVAALLVAMTSCARGLRAVWLPAVRGGHAC